MQSFHSRQDVIREQPQATRNSASGANRVKFIVPHLIISSLITLIVLSGCGQGQGPEPQAASRFNIVLMPEASQYRTLASGGDNITWIEPGAAGSEWDPMTGKNEAGEAVRNAGDALAEVDYASLSLPDFITYTRALKLQPTDFSGRDTEIDAFGTDPQGGKWALYRWQGPEFPQHPDRPVVHRWVSVYVLYDLSNSRVARLLPTIQGEAQE
jgi:hypothetical protein